MYTHRTAGALGVAPTSGREPLAGPPARIRE